MIEGAIINIMESKRYKGELFWDLLQSNLENQSKSILEKISRNGQGREDYIIRMPVNKQTKQKKTWFLSKELEISYLA